MSTKRKSTGICPYPNRRSYVDLRVIGITGGRDRKATRDQRRAIAAMGLHIPTILLQGYALGIDQDVGNRAREAGWISQPVRAEWATLGYDAGHIRNAIIVRGCDFLVTFGGNRGTKNCQMQAYFHGKPLVDLSGLGPREGEDISVKVRGGRKTRRPSRWRGNLPP